MFKSITTRYFLLLTVSKRPFPTERFEVVNSRKLYLWCVSPGSGLGGRGVLVPRWALVRNRAALSHFCSRYELHKISHLNSRKLFDLLHVSQVWVLEQHNVCEWNIIGNPEPVMFTCMNITVAPGGQGGRWHILWTDPAFSLCEINMQIPLWGVSSERKKWKLRSQSVNGVTTNPFSHKHTGKTRISQRR